MPLPKRKGVKKITHLVGVAICCVLRRSVEVILDNSSLIREVNLQGIFMSDTSFKNNSRNATLKPMMYSQ